MNRLSALRKVRARVSFCVFFGERCAVMNEEDFGAFSQKKKYQNQEEVCYLSRVDESEFGKKNEKKNKKNQKKIKWTRRRRRRRRREKM